MKPDVDRQQAPNDCTGDGKVSGAKYSPYQWSMSMVIAYMHCLVISMLVDHYHSLVQSTFHLVLPALWLLAQLNSISIITRSLERVQ